MDPVYGNKSSRGKNGDVSLRDKAYRYIVSRILSGEMPSGTVISEIPLSREIRTSRTPVREAIGQLVSEGLLEQVPGRGTIVTRPGRNDIIDLYELREALETYALRKIAGARLIEPYRPALRRLCDVVHELAEELRRSGQERLDEAQMQRFVPADMGFHMLLLQAAGNRRIGKVVAETRVLTRIFAYRREGHDAPLLDTVHAYHSGVLDAIDAADAETAVQRLGEHIRTSMRERLETYDRWERQHEMNRLMPLPAEILDKLEQMQIGGPPGAHETRS